LAERISPCQVHYYQDVNLTPFGHVRYLERGMAEPGRYREDATRHVRT